MWNGGFIDPHLIDTYYTNEDVEDLWEEGLDRSEEIEYIRKAVELLTMQDKELYTDLYLLNKTCTDIAREKGCSINTVNSKKALLTKRLTAILLQPTPPSDEMIERNIARLSTLKARNVIRKYLITPSSTTVARELDMKVQSVGRIVSRVLTYDLEYEFITYLKYLNNISASINCTTLKMQ